MHVACHKKARHAPTPELQPLPRNQAMLELRSTCRRRSQSPYGPWPSWASTRAACCWTLGPALRSSSTRLVARPAQILCGRWLSSRLVQRALSPSWVLRPPHCAPSACNASRPIRCLCLRQASSNLLLALAVIIELIAASADPGHHACKGCIAEAGPLRHA